MEASKKAMVKFKDPMLVKQKAENKSNIGKQRYRKFKTLFLLTI
jgi:hypothetical protein